MHKEGDEEGRDREEMTERYSVHIIYMYKNIAHTHTYSWCQYKVSVSYRLLYRT